MILRKGKIKIDPVRCKGCLLCIEACKQGEIKVSKEINKFGYHLVEFVNNGNCNACTLCGVVCPDAAIEITKCNGQEEKDHDNK